MSHGHGHHVSTMYAPLLESMRRALQEIRASESILRRSNEFHAAMDALADARAEMASAWKEFEEVERRISDASRQ
jgi:hypothetical protein